MPKRIMTKHRHKLIELSKHKDLAYLSGYIQALLDQGAITVYEYTKLVDQAGDLEVEKINISI